MRFAILATIVLVTPAALALLPLPPPPTDPSIVGQWGEPFDGQVPAVNMVLLHDNKVLYWSGTEASPDDDLIYFTTHPVHAVSRVLDLATMTVTAPPEPEDDGGDLFCSGNTVLPDGRVLTVGGTEWAVLPSLGTPLYGLSTARIFDPATGAWSLGDPMSDSRWYPSVITTPEGDGLVASGIGTLTMPDTHRESIERFVAGNWQDETGADRLLPLYPRISVVPGGPLKGDLFYQTVGTLWGTFGEHPLEGPWSLQQAYDFDTATWDYLGPSLFGVRQHAAVVPLMLLQGRDYAPELLTFGGTLQRSVVATPVAEIADLESLPVVNTMVNPMNFPRWHLNGVLLPSGEVLAVGGGLYDNVVVHGQPDPPVLEAEIFDQAKQRWTTLAPMQVPRMYHSTALLLPDARVLVGGHVPLANPFKLMRDNLPGQEQISEKRFEIFSPPYLFRGARPIILDAPTSITYNSTFDITVDTNSGLHSLVLVRPGATTHAFDGDQRGIVLDVEDEGTQGLEVETPPDEIVAPPGWYMLFVNKSHPDGPIPSLARWVHLS